MYQSRDEVYIILVPQPIELNHSGVHHHLPYGSLLVIDPSISRVWGIQRKELKVNFVKVPGKPHFYRKIPGAPLANYPFGSEEYAKMKETTRTLKRLDFAEVFDASQMDMSDAPLYKKVVPVMAFWIPVRMTFIHSWGHQTMEHTDFMLVDPSIAEVYGCEGETYETTYAEIDDLPGFCTKVAKVRAIQMDRRFSIGAIDKQEHPELGEKGDYVIETVRTDGRKDRYLIRQKRFPQMYVLSPEDD